MVSTGLWYPRLGHTIRKIVTVAFIHRHAPNQFLRYFCCFQACLPQTTECDRPVAGRLNLMFRTTRQPPGLLEKAATHIR